MSVESGHVSQMPLKFFVNTSLRYAGGGGAPTSQGAPSAGHSSNITRYPLVVTVPGVSQLSTLHLLTSTDHTCCEEL